MGNITARGMLRGKVTAIPRVDDTLTKKGQAADAQATGNALNDRVKTEDIVNTLVSEEVNKPLSANMGKELAAQIGQAKKKAANDLDTYKTEAGTKANQTAQELIGLANRIDTNKQNINRIDSAVKAIPYGKVFTYIGDGGYTERRIEVGIDCRMLVVMHTSVIIFIGENASWAVNNAPGQDTANPRARYKNGELVIDPLESWEGNTVHYFNNAWLNEDGWTYTCYALM